MAKLPTPSKEKQMPAGTIVNTEIPNESKQKEETPTESSLINETPTESSLKNETPTESPLKNETPTESEKKEEIPEASPTKEEMPSDKLEENCVLVNGQKIELKPTKLKYFRNKAASGYGIIKAVPLHELLTYGKGVLDENRDADQLLYDFLIAAFDNPTFVRDNYEEFDAEVIQRVITIFGRLNHIDEKEEQARKNREAQAKR